MRSILFSLFIFSLILPGCEKVDDPFPPKLEVVDTGIVWDDSVFSGDNESKRFVLMEEYTGHLCRNCPGGAREISRIVDKYGEEFIPISIHTVDAFAMPLPGYAPGYPESFSSDFRTESGDIYGSQFSIPSLPAGVVSRRKVNSAFKLNIGQWETEALKIMGQDAEANINITNFYDDSTKTFRVRIRIDWLKDYAGDLNLQVQLLQDSIVAWQEDGGDFISDYVHRHMFREAVNGTWGDLLPAAPAGEMTEMVYTREFDPKGIGYVIEHMSIVAFLYKEAPDYEVMQVNEAHLIHQ